MTTPFIKQVIDQLDSRALRLSVVMNTNTELFHGAVLVDHSTPEQSNIFTIAQITVQGYHTQRSAVEAINKEYPHLPPVDMASLPEGTDEDIDQLILMLPPNALLTHMTPRTRGSAMEEGVPEVEVRAFDCIAAPILNIKISVEQLKTMIRRKLIHLTSSTGNDPELYYRYDNYLLGEA